MKGVDILTSRRRSSFLLLDPLLDDTLETLDPLLRPPLVETSVGRVAGVPSHSVCLSRHFPPSSVSFSRHRTLIARRGDGGE